MSLFSSSSSSSYATYNTSQNQSSTMGDLAHDNIVVGGDYVPVGLSDGNLDMVLGFASNAFSQASQAFNTVAGRAQESANTAIDSVSSAYARANNETTAMLQDIKPLVVYAGLGVLIYALMRR
ncbi:hypothetical protein FACS1894186_4280 [Alphaproteobacteria bacterium]|nr:hypothetical protein FACS1894186_4280 [Alphaproteobacteria bacterium]